MSLPKPKKKQFYKRWWFWTLLVLGTIIVVAVVAGLSAYQESQREAYAYLEETVSVEKRVLNKTISTDGEITPEQHTQLYTSLPNSKITEVNVTVGDEVTVGDVLIKTDGGPAPDEEIEAPFDGRVLAVHTFVGDVPSLAIPVIEIGYRTNHIEFLASESEVIDLNEGQHVTITIPSYENGDDEYDGKVTFVDVQKQTIASSAASGAVAESGYVIHVNADDLPEAVRNIIGISVDVVVDIYETESVLSIEPSAIQYDDNDEAFVYIPPVVDDTFIAEATVAEDVTDVLQQKEVEVGFKGDEYYEITDGLRDNENVLLYIPSNSGAGGLF